MRLEVELALNLFKPTRHTRLTRPRRDTPRTTVYQKTVHDTFNSTYIVPCCLFVVHQSITNQISCSVVKKQEEKKKRARGVRVSWICLRVSSGLQFWTWKI